MTLKDLPVGGSGRVAGITGEAALKRRIMDMGITHGAEVFVRRLAPMGDPMQVTVRGYQLSLRAQDAQNIQLV